MLGGIVVRAVWLSVCSMSAGARYFPGVFFKKWPPRPEGRAATDLVFSCQAEPEKDSEVRS